MMLWILLILSLVGCSRPADQDVYNKERTVGWTAGIYGDGKLRYDVWYNDRLNSLPDTLKVVIPK